MYVSGNDRTGAGLAALAVDTGRLRWSRSISGEYGSIAAVADGTVVAVSGGRIWAFTT